MEAKCYSELSEMQSVTTQKTVLFIVTAVNTSYTISELKTTKNSVNKLYRPSDGRLSAKLVPTFASIRCRVVSATNFHLHILGFLDRSREWNLDLWICSQEL
jgi:hypothetical protein